VLTANAGDDVVENRQAVSNRYS